jgi:aminocarboxymuconate-semialdehyde decarboxylase
VIIDAHAHYVPPEFLDEVASGRRPFPSVKLANESGAFRFAFANNDAKQPVPPGMSDTDKRRQWLADHGIDKQIVGGTAAKLFRIGA